jgi:hypothetical protein
VTLREVPAIYQWTAPVVFSAAGPPGPAPSCLAPQLLGSALSRDRVTLTMALGQHLRADRIARWATGPSTVSHPAVNLQLTLAKSVTPSQTHGLSVFTEFCVAQKTPAQAPYLEEQRPLLGKWVGEGKGETSLQ